MFNTINNRIKLNSQKFIADFELSKFLEQSIPVLIGIFIFFNPFPHTTAIKEISFYLSVFIVLILIISKKIDFSFKTPLMIPFGLFVFWSFIGLFFALDKENSFHDFYSHLLRYIILYFILTHFVNTKKRLIHLSWIIIISSSIFIVGGLFYFYFILENSLSLRFGTTNAITQTGHNIIGVIVSFAFVLVLNQLHNENSLYFKVSLAFSILTLLIGLLMSQTRSSLVAVFLAVIIVLHKNKKWMFVFLSLILMIVAISPIKKRIQLNGSGSDNMLKDVRIRTNFATLEVIKEYPIFGIGFGLQTYGKLDLTKYQKRLPMKYRDYIFPDPHNMVMDIAVRLGIIGLVLFFYIIFVFFKMCWDIIKHGKDNFTKNWGRCLAAAFIAVSVIGLFQPIFSHMPEVVICTIFSMTTVVWRLNNLREEERAIRIEERGKREEKKE